MSRTHRATQALVQSPFLWGALGAGAFYGVLSSGVLGDRLGELAENYFSSHPVEYVATVMFFVGIAALAIKMVLAAVQYHGLRTPLLGPVAGGGEAVAHCQALLAQLDGLPPRRHDDYGVRRVRQALEHVRRRGSAEALDEELKYLADLDAARLNDSYALVRVIIWAIPILGFLGTVIGITLAVANLAPKALETSLPEVVAGLSVAFNTTAQALGLSMVLMFGQFFVDRAETRLLGLVDQRAEDELSGRFEQIAASPDGQVVAIRRMAETLLETTEQLVRRQAELWQASIEAAAGRWTTMAEAAERKLQGALSVALAESLKDHARELGAAQLVAAEENRRHWDRVQQGLVQNTESMAAVQKNLVRQAETIGRAVEATGQIARLEEALNRNLAALAGSRNFEQTVNSLAAAIHLLNARLGHVPEGTAAVQLEGKKRTGQAA